MWSRPGRSEHERARRRGGPDRVLPGGRLRRQHPGAAGEAGRPARPGLPRPVESGVHRRAGVRGLAGGVGRGDPAGRGPGVGRPGHPGRALHGRAVRGPAVRRPRRGDRPTGPGAGPQRPVPGLRRTNTDDVGVLGCRDRGGAGAGRIPAGAARRRGHAGRDRGRAAGGRHGRRPAGGVDQLGRRPGHPARALDPWRHVHPPGALCRLVAAGVRGVPPDGRGGRPCPRRVLGRHPRERHRLRPGRRAGGGGVSDLRKSMGGAVGTFVALSTILGSGMMILPGTSYHELGRSAWMPWAIAAVSVIPLLYCYAWLGRRHPSASGVAHYSEIALGPAAGHTAGLLAILALVAGIPATAITGGRYVAEFTGAGSLAWVFPVAVLAAATAVAGAGATVSGRLQVGLILGLFAVVTCTAVVALGAHGLAAPGTELPASSRLGGVLTAVYVAFTGWETVAFTFEEHKRPDVIPRIFAASYGIVVALYALLLFGLLAAVD